MKSYTISHSFYRFILAEKDEVGPRKRWMKYQVELKLAYHWWTTTFFSQHWAWHWSGQSCHSGPAAEWRVATDWQSPECHWEKHWSSVVWWCLHWAMDTSKEESWWKICILEWDNTVSQCCSCKRWTNTLRLAPKEHNSTLKSTYKKQYNVVNVIYHCIVILLCLTV